jgi:predicted nucleic acid-binding protein
MLVVADSSPVIALVNIEHISVLPSLFGQVVIPPQVAEELARPARPAPVRSLIVSPPAWLLQQSPAAIEPIPLLHAGELAAISLARELRADLLLIDEARGRQAAAARQIPFAGTIGILELAADRGLLDLGIAFASLKTTDFWISDRFLDERLETFKRHRTP